jgi:hypothetical protein
MQMETGKQDCWEHPSTITDREGKYLTFTLAKAA